MLAKAVAFTAGLPPKEKKAAGTGAVSSGPPARWRAGFFACRMRSSWSSWHFCIVYHLFDLIPDADTTWQPSFTYA